MTNEESEAKRQEWIIDYLYGELDDEQKKIFEQTLETDAQLKKIYEEHTALDVMIPKGSAPLISDERMQGVRWASVRSLRQPKQASLKEKLKTFWQVRIPMQLQVASMAAMFFIGFIVSEKSVQPVPIEVDPAPRNVGALEFVNLEDYQIMDVKLNSFDQAKGDVTFSFALASESQVNGNMENPKIREFLAQTLKTVRSDDVRLELSSLLGAYTVQSGVRDAMIYTLHNDPNPGVRYNAVEHLVKSADQKVVREALEYALINDVNPGIRVEAFLSLSERVDESLLEILRDHSVNDANTFIRERSKRILNEYSENMPQPQKAATI